MNQIVLVAGKSKNSSEKNRNTWIGHFQIQYHFLFFERIDWVCRTTNRYSSFCSFLIRNIMINKIQLAKMGPSC